MHTHQTNKQFVRYVLPAVVSMVVQAMYVVLDGVIVGQGLGETALAAVNLAFPASMIVIALAMLIAVGGANVYSIYRGTGEDGQANNIFNQCLTLAVGAGLVLAVSGLVFLRPLAVFMGANDALLPETTAYLRWLAPFSLLQMAVCLLSTFIRNDNAPRTVMYATVTGAVVNAGLDVLFILVLGWGIEMSAITNGIGMLIELVFYAVHFAAKRGALRIRLPRFHAADLGRILKNGAATFLIEFSVPAVTFSFNLAIVRTMDTLGVTAYSIVGYVCALINMTLIGVTQGTQPLMSFYHGNGDKKAFSHVYRLGLYTNLIVSAVLSLLCMLGGAFIVPLFRPGNAALTAMTVDMIRIYPAAHIAIGVTMMNILYFQTTERNAHSFSISLLRCAGFVQLFILLSVFVLGGQGLFFAYPAGELVHMAIACALLAVDRRREAQAPTAVAAARAEESAS